MRSICMNISMVPLQAPTLVHRRTGCVPKSIGHRVGRQFGGLHRCIGFRPRAGSIERDSTTAVRAQGDTADGNELDRDVQDFQNVSGEGEESADIADGAGAHHDSTAVETTVDMLQEAENEQAPLAPHDGSPVAKVQQLMRANPVASYSVLAIAGFLGFTFVIAVLKTIGKGFTKQGKRSNTINKNKLVIDELNKYLPNNRDSLSGTTMGGIRFRTGFSPTEIFRKYLWYLLRERKFDHDALADVVALKRALSLSDQEVSEALKERASRIYEKYGTVMLDTSGMSSAGIERKATSRALFSKLLYLVETDDVLAEEYRDKVDLQDIFGATSDDVARLRIASLYEVDLDAIMEQPSASPLEANDED